MSNHTSIAKLYRRVLRAQRAVFHDDQRTIDHALQWTRDTFRACTDPHELARDMDWLCTFLTKNLVQLESTDGRVFKLKWRDTLETDDGDKTLTAVRRCC